MTKKAENFEMLISESLKEWPQHIAFGNLNIHRHFNYPQDDFTVEGLYEAYEKICEKYIDHEHAILWLNIHHAIYIVTHGAAKYVDCLDISNLRQAEVKYCFEKIIESFIDNKNGESREIDIQLALEYFKEEGRSFNKKST